MTARDPNVSGPERPTTLSEVRAFLAEDRSARERGGHGPEPVTGWVALRTFRLGQYLHVARGPLASLLRPLWKALDLVWVRLILDAEMNADVAFGPGLVLPGGGRRVQFPKGAVYGSRVTVYNGSCLGGERPRPTIGDDVVLRNDCYLIRSVVVGRGAHVGPWSNVLHDVPPGARVLGTPAKVVPEDEGFDF